MDGVMGLESKVYFFKIYYINELDSPFLPFLNAAHDDIGTQKQI